MWSGSAPSLSSRAPLMRQVADDPEVLLSLHGHGVRLALHVPSVAAIVRHVLRTITQPTLPGKADITGAVLPYVEGDVVRHLSTDAERFGDPRLELYRDRARAERFWLVDERWGICEVDLLRRAFRSWILPAPACDPVRLYEAAVVWPMAQILRTSGLHLIPGSAVGRDGKGVLILAPFDVGPELDTLASANVGILGQRWVALREADDGRVMLLQMPGCSESQVRSRPLAYGASGHPSWRDLAADRSGALAKCELVLLAEPMRRSASTVVPLTEVAAREELKRAWPVPCTSSMAAMNRITLTLARDCRVHRVRLSRDASALARLLVRPGLPAAAA